MRNDWRSRQHPAYWAFLVHRISGVLLALFLPFHFWALSQALHGAARLDDFLRWTEHPLAKIAEFGLIVLLAAHLTGGVRLLMLEFLQWREWQKALLTIASVLTVFVGVAFLIDVF